MQWKILTRGEPRLLVVATKWLIGSLIITLSVREWHFILTALIPFKSSKKYYLKSVPVSRDSTLQRFSSCASTSDSYGLLSVKMVWPDEDEASRNETLTNGPCPSGDGLSYIPAGNCPTL